MVEWDAKCKRLIDSINEGFDKTKPFADRCFKGDIDACKKFAHNMTILRDRSFDFIFDCIIKPGKWRPGGK